MENTGKALFQDDDIARWYVAMGESWIGPLKAEDIYKKIVLGEVTWAHFIWKQGMTDWQRVCDVADFKSIAPHQPAAKPSAKPGEKQASKVPEKSDRIWFLYSSNVQSGPFSETEIRESLKSGKVNARAHIWRDGMGNWERIEKVAMFAKEVESPSQKIAQKEVPVKVEKVDLRSNPRRPLVARIFLSNDESIVVGVCRDISIGGMQVLTDRIPGEIGSKIKMNVSPAQVEGDKKIDPFVAKGKIVRFLEDGRGFSFRFDQLPADSKNAIETYLDSAS